MSEISPVSTLISFCDTLPQKCSEREPVMPDAKAKQKLKPFPLRLPEDLYEAIAAMAEADVRPVNSQIVFLLREAVARRRGEQERSPSMTEER